VIILLTVVTGLLWAYAPYLYWHEGYLEKKHAAPRVSLEAVRMTPQDAIRLARERLGENADVSSVALRAEAGMPVYEVVGKGTSGKETSILIEAHQALVWAPIPREYAVEIARQYVAGEPEVESVQLLDEFKHRSGKLHPSVYQVRFQNPRSTEIFLSAQSGKILEDQDEIRRFHFWVMRLHMLNFFGSKKTLTIIPGAALLVLLVSGIWISRRRRKARYSV
jgi:uncharacterized membrane protein YkoI